MNKIVPFTKFTQAKKAADFPFLSEVSVVLNQKGTPQGFVFGRDSFISFLETMDAEFEEKVSDPKKAYHNPAGRLIDLIEETLTVDPRLVKDLKTSAQETKQSEWISLEDVKQSLHV